MPSKKKRGEGQEVGLRGPHHQPKRKGVPAYLEGKGKKWGKPAKKGHPEKRSCPEKKGEKKKRGGGEVTGVLGPGTGQLSPVGFSDAAQQRLRLERKACR